MNADDPTRQARARALTELFNARVVFWQCPVEAHRHSYPEPVRETVRWTDGVAHCLEPGCGRTSADSKVTSPSLTERLHEFFHVGLRDTWACTRSSDPCPLLANVVEPMQNLIMDWMRDRACLLQDCTFTEDGCCRLHGESCPDCACGSALHEEPQ